MKQNVLCRCNKYGHCKYGDKCHFRHNNVVCVTANCGVFDCDKRHLVNCKYHRNFRICKFDNCNGPFYGNLSSYNHGNRNKGNGAEEKIKILETKLKENDDKNKNIVKKLEAFEKTNEVKLKAAEIQLLKIKKLDEVKDVKIVDLKASWLKWKLNLNSASASI